MPQLKDTSLEGFDSPIGLPLSDGQAHQWQEANRNWWNDHPMRYDWGRAVAFPDFSREFYAEIDERFFTSAESYIPCRRIPFDRFIDFPSLGEKDVLEIGVGNGSHAGLLARHSRTFTGIDLTPYAAKSASIRMKLFALNGRILQMDAERLAFPDNSFDFIWTWGVIHHSSDTRKVLAEMQRVLRPGGLASVMVYHRSFWNWYIVNGIFVGMARGEFRRVRELHRIVQSWTDGAIARYYTIPEWRTLAGQFFNVEKVDICGLKAEMIPLPSGKFKDRILQVVPDALTRLFTNRLRCGSFIVSRLVKPA